MSKETKALMRACKVSRARDKAFNAWMQAMKESGGKDDAPEVQKLRKAFKDADANFSSMKDELNDIVGIVPIGRLP